MAIVNLARPRAWVVGAEAEAEEEEEEEEEEEDVLVLVLVLLSSSDSAVISADRYRSAAWYTGIIAPSTAATSEDSEAEGRDSRIGDNLAVMSAGVGTACVENERARRAAAAEDDRDCDVVVAFFL
jgi:hypothetical protein